jgi:hypothetical protein
MSNPAPESWPAALDALVAAPHHHELLLEDNRARVLITRIAAGDTVPLHTHRWPSVAHVISWSHFIRRGPDGSILFDSRNSPPPAKVPFAQWLEPLPLHTVENVGGSEIYVYVVEFKEGERPGG